jgi:hypothetical protein
LSLSRNRLEALTGGKLLNPKLLELQTGKVFHESHFCSFKTLRFSKFRAFAASTGWKLISFGLLWLQTVEFSQVFYF